MSKIIKARESFDDGACQRHLFPKLENGQSLDDAFSKGESDGFRPVCPESVMGAGKEAFEQLFEGDDDLSSGGEKPMNLEETHIIELKEEFSRGYLEGENSGAESERQRVEPAIQALERCVLELEKCRKSLIKHFEKTSVELAIAIAEKIVSHEVSINKRTLIDVLKATVEQAGGNEVLEIRINPSDVEVLRDAGFSLADLNAENASLEGDNAVSCGGCLVRTDFGSVDGTIEHQLEAVSEALREQF